MLATSGIHVFIQLMGVWACIFGFVGVLWFAAAKSAQPSRKDGENRE
jgi:hypothetical protein